MIMRIFFLLLVLTVPVINYAQVETLLESAVEKKLEVKYSIDNNSVNNNVLMALSRLNQIVY